MSDEDLAALIGYLRSRPPVDREMPEPRVGPVARALYLAGNLPLLPVEADRPRREAAGADARRHGGVRPVPRDDRRMPQLPRPGPRRRRQSRRARHHRRPAGRSWTEEDFFHALRRGMRPDGSVIDPEKMPWVASGRMTDEEIRAVWLYLRSLPAGARKTVGGHGEARAAS